VAFDIEMRHNTSVVPATVVPRHELPSDVFMAALNQELTEFAEVSGDMQQGTLLDFHKRLTHLNYNAMELLANKLRSGIYLTDHKRVNCLTFAEGKQTKNRRFKKDTDTLAHQKSGRRHLLRDKGATDPQVPPGQPIYGELRSLPVELLPRVIDAHQGRGCESVRALPRVLREGVRLQGPSFAYRLQRRVR